MGNAQGGIIIGGVEDAKQTMVGVPPVSPPFERSDIHRGTGSGSQAEKPMGCSHTLVHDDGEPC
jgi:hypothetical protein